jgi:hypothetical protein
MLSIFVVTAVSNTLYHYPVWIFFKSQEKVLEMLNFCVFFITETDFKSIFSDLLDVVIFNNTPKLEFTKNHL